MAGPGRDRFGKEDEFLSWLLGDTGSGKMLDAFNDMKGEHRGGEGTRGGPGRARHGIDSYLVFKYGATKAEKMVIGLNDEDDDHRGGDADKEGPGRDGSDPPTM